jgi:hypothetical protein
MTDGERPQNMTVNASFITAVLASSTSAQTSKVLAALRRCARLPARLNVHCETQG